MRHSTGLTSNKKSCHLFRAVAEGSWPSLSSAILAASCSACRLSKLPPVPMTDPWKCTSTFHHLSCGRGRVGGRGLAAGTAAYASALRGTLPALSMCGGPAWPDSNQDRSKAVMCRTAAKL